VFDSAVSTPFGSGISNTNNATGSTGSVITLSDAGVYLVTFGYSPAENAATELIAFSLEYTQNAGTSYVPYPAGTANEAYTLGAFLTGETSHFVMTTLSVIIDTTAAVGASSPFKFKIINTSGGSRDIVSPGNPTSGTATGTPAFINITRLK
jgi:hypothetical protein